MTSHTLTRSYIAGTGAFLPKTVLNNEVCGELAGVSPEWIVRRTGILERRIAAEGTGTAFMAAAAGRQAMERTGVSSDEVDAVIVATSTPDHLTPPTACEVQAVLGCSRAAAFDLEAGFSAWVYALIVADSLIRSGAAAIVLVIGADTLSSITDRSDPETGPLFGDGAGAAILRSDSGLAQVLETSWWADGRLAQALVRPGGGARMPFDETVLSQRTHLLSMEGTRLFRNSVRTMADQSRVVLGKAGIALDDVGLIVPHQANLRIIQTFARLAGVEWNRVFVNIDRYGNTGAATIPIALHEAAEQGIIRNSQPTLLVGFGAGATAGAVLLGPTA